MDERNKEEKLEKVVEEANVQVKKAVDKEPTAPKGSFFKNSFQSRKFKSGAYATTMSVIVVAIVLVINVLVSQFGWKLDVSKNSMFTLSKTTKDVLKDLQDDITIYYLVQPGNEYKYFQNLAEKYDNTSSRVTLEYKDPVVYPKFSAQYTDERVSENSVIVVDNKTNRSKYIDGSKMLSISYNQMGQSTPTGIDFEGKVTAAIQYVTTEDCPKFYQVVGHGEKEAGKIFTDLLEKVSIELESLTLAKETKIPEDCKVLIISAPQQDFSTEETEVIREYLTAGGKAMVFVDDKTSACTNFSKDILGYYGVELMEGFALESDFDHMISQSPYNVVPELNKECELMTDYEETDNLLIAPFCVAMKEADTVRSLIHFEPIMTSTNASYIKKNLDSEHLDKEEGDYEGPLNLGIYITETYNGTKTELTVLNVNSFGESVLSVNSFANYNLLSFIARQFSDSKVETLAIPPKQFDTTTLTITSSQQIFWRVFSVVLIPVCILAIGGFVVVRRRKK